MSFDISDADREARATASTCRAEVDRVRIANEVAKVDALLPELLSQIKLAFRNGDKCFTDSLSSSVPEGYLEAQLQQRISHLGWISDISRDEYSLTTLTVTFPAE